MTAQNTLVFIDGENLSFRYKELVASGKVPRPDNVLIQDCFVWNQRVLNDHIWSIKRLSYYTSIVGDDVLVRSVREQIARTTYRCTTAKTTDSESIRTGQIVPFVKKKTARSRKESICDIAIAVDVMRACYRDHAETIWIFSGDGDFIQLIEEVVHSGKIAYVSAFSSGLNPDLPIVVDEFLSLDKYFFLSEAEIEQAKAVASEANATTPQQVSNPLPEAEIHAPIAIA
jgi:uncharacterized LabA/DUF88 family protein